MKKFFLSILIGTAIISCEKSTIQQTTDHFKKADSLFTKANEGMKTLDSISKTINSKDGITSKVIIPEIEKQKKAIDSTIKSGSWEIDSINQQIQDITKNVKTGTHVVKTLDSANEALKKGANPLEVLSKTADKILKQTKPQKENTQTPSKPEIQSQNSPSNVPLIVERNPLVKTARLEIEVENLTNAKALLKQKFLEHHADLATENFLQTEGISKESFSAKVPLSYFDQLVNSASTLGEIRMKSTVSQGIDYDAEQLCDVEISLFQNENLWNNSLAKKESDSLKTDSFGDKSSKTFMQGFKVLGDGLLFLLPFWPVLLIGILVWYFVARNKKRKAKEEFERQQALNQQKIQYPKENQTSTEPVAQQQNDEDQDHGETDYSKYMPKK